VECSFETSSLIHFSPNTPSHSSPEASSPAASGQSPASVSDSYGGLNTLAAAASSRHSAEAVTHSPIPPRQSRMLPEDLVPTAMTPIWGCVSRVDWTATPMLAIQELVRCPRTDIGSQLPGGRLSDILSPPEIISLLEMFVLSLHGYDPH
jgi:hypothetical protein